MRYAFLLVAATLALSCDDNAKEAIMEEDTSTTADARTDSTVDGLLVDSTTTDTRTFVVPPGCVESPAEVRAVPWVARKPDLLTHEFPTSAVVLRTVEEFVAVTGEAPPAEIQFPEEVAVLATSFEVFPTPLVAEGIADCGTESRVVTALTNLEGCPRLEGFWAAYALFAMSPASAYVSLEVDERVVVTFSCPQSGGEAGDTCDGSRLCNSDSYCAGLTRAPEGECVPLAQVARFESAVTTPIPDGELPGATTTNLVAGVMGVAADVVVTLEVDHPAPRDLTITLIGPDGTTVQMWEQDAGVTTRLTRPAWGFEGKDPNGAWTLELRDEVTGNVGELDRWKIEFVTVVE